MANIHHKFPINASISKVFECISTPEGLDIWWGKSTKGTPGLNEIYQFDFGPGYLWEAKVSQFVENETFELTITKADTDWAGTKIGFRLKENKGTTDVEFYNTNWKEESEHFRISSFCWAMYLRLLKRYVEFGEIVSYEERLNV